VLEGLVKNAEMAAKENINSGFPLIAEPSVLHRTLLNCIASNPNIPLDVFENGEVVREEHYCAPAYLFYCNATASYHYEIAQWTTHKTAIDLGDRTRVEKEQIRDYTPMNSTAYVSKAMITSGNKSAAELINDIYMFLDPNRLYDFEDLDFPHDVITYDFNMPQAAAFNEYVRPVMEYLLELEAQRALDGKDYQNLTMGGGSRIDKDEIVRIYLGLYRVVFKYGGEEYSLWLSGDGKDFRTDGMPVDHQRDAQLNAKRQAMESEVASVPVPSTGKFTGGFWGCIGGGLLLGAIIHPILILLGIGGAVYFKIAKSKMMAPYHSKCTEIRGRHQAGIDEFEAQASRALQQFRDRRQPLRGVYEHSCAGDSSAF